MRNLGFLPERSIFVFRKIPESGNIVRESVAPDVHRLILITRNRNTPRQTRFWARERDIFESLIQERERLIGAGIGNNLVRAFQKFFEPIALALEEKEPVLLFHFLRCLLMDGTFAINQFFGGDEPFATAAIQD